MDIPLSLHLPVEDMTPATIGVETDMDSSIWPDAWIAIRFSDSDHDSQGIEMTFPEAEALYLQLQEHLSVWLTLPDRLSLVQPGSVTKAIREAKV